MAAPPPLPNPLASNGHEYSEPTTAGARETGKRGRGFTTTGANGGPSAIQTQGPRTLRAQSTRSPDGSHPFERLQDRTLSTAHLQNRQILSSDESAQLRGENLHALSGTALTKSPDGLPPVRDAPLHYETPKAAHLDNTNGHTPVSTTTAVTGHNSLRRVTTVESLHGNNGATVSGAEFARGEGRTNRLNRQSLRKDLSPRSASRRPSNTPADIHTVGDFAQEHLFTSFVTQADQKIGLVNNGNRLQIDVNVEGTCGPGVDHAFDQLLLALGHIARGKPRPMVEKLIQWRESHARRTGVLRQDSLQLKALPDPNAATSQEPTPENPKPLPNVQPSSTMSKALAEAEAFLTDRRTYVVTYLFFRALASVLSKVEQGSLSLPLVERLEHIAFTSLRALNFAYLGRFPLKRVQWRMAKDVLELLSVLDFEGVSSRFLADLRTYQKDLSQKPHANKNIENEPTHLLKSMRHLRLPTESGKAWNRSCLFMQILTELFGEVHGQPAKIAYCKMIGGILLTIGERVNTDFDNELWKQLVSKLNDRLGQLAAKPKYWQVAYPVQVTLACVSPYESLVSRWQALTGSLSTKLRERNNRATALKAACRLVWSYLQRSRDPRERVMKNLEDLLRLVFFSGKRYSLSLEPAVAEPLIQLIRIVGHKAYEMCMKAVVFPLLNYELFANRDVKELKIDQIDPDRTCIAIRAFLAILADTESGDSPHFPVDFEDERFADAAENAELPRDASSSYAFGIERLSKPVIMNNFSDVNRTYYTGFCRVLGKIAIVCADAFGGHAVLDEKAPPPVPKTPMSEAWTFKRDDGSNSAEERASYYELLRVAIHALPRCLINQPSLNPLFSLLCTGTAHVEKPIAGASYKSLLSIARQGHAQMIIERFSSFINNYDHRCFSTLEGYRANSNHLESALRLYIELLHIWKDEIHSKRTKAVSLQMVESPSGTRNGYLDMSGTWTQIDRVESHGLLFLTSPSSRIRTCATEILNLVTKLDATLGQANIRIATILETDPSPVLNLQHETLSSWERSRLERGKRQNNGQPTLIDLCCSPGEHDTVLWVKLFPNLIRAAFEQCPVAVTQTREDVCFRLSHMHNMVETLDERHRMQQQTLTMDVPPARQSRNISNVTAALAVAQWKLYLMFACTTLTRTGGTGSSTTQEPAHVRKSSRSSQGAQESINTAKDLFAKVIPLLSASSPQIRDAAVTGLGSINVNLYKPLLEALDAVDKQPMDELRKHQSTHQRGTSSPRRVLAGNQFQAEVVQVYKLTAHFLSNPEVLKNERILAHISYYTRGLSKMLREAEEDWDLQKLRIGYCGLVEGFYLGIVRNQDTERWMSFGARRAAFTLMEDWCGYSNSRSDVPTRVFEHSPTQNEIDSLVGQAATRAHERNQLRIVALNAMATLCAGPVRFVVNDGEKTYIHEFNARKLLEWIHNVFKSESDKTHATGRRALKNLILHNISSPVLLEKSIDKLYVAETGKALESYIEVVSDIFMGENAPKIAYFKIFSALLFILGNERSSIRRKSARLLRFLDEQEAKGSKLQDLDISISDRTTAVNKKAQFEISQRLALQHSEHAFWVFSEFSMHFNQLHADHKRNIVLALLPWIKTLELQLDPNGGPTASSYMLLVNLLKMTMDHSTTLHHEIQALWQALATGPHAGNVKLILDFIIDLCLQRRDEKLVQVAKQVVVFLSSTPAGQKVIESLMLQIGPTTMWEDKSRAVLQPHDSKQFPYLADLSNTPSDNNGSFSMSLGHLCLILLVDLIVAPVTLPVHRVTLLLHTLLTLWDHRMEVVRTQARELLVHLMHELVISKMDETDQTRNMPSIEVFLELIRSHDSKVVWTYEDNNGAHTRYDLTESIVHVVTEIVRVFSITYPGIGAAWGVIAMHWATICPVRHLACRSLQIYRCILTPLEPKVIVELLQRLHTSVSDEESLFQSYSVDLLRTFRAIIEDSGTGNAQLLPMLFWTTCACLDSSVEAEFLEAVPMLEGILKKKDLADPGVVSLLLEKKPKDFTWSSELLSGRVYKGCRSEAGITRCLDVLDRLIRLPSNAIVGDENRLLYITLANLPRMRHSFDDSTSLAAVTATAKILADVARSRKAVDLAQVMDDFIGGRISDAEEFLRRALDAIAADYFPIHEAGALKFLIGLLPNNTSWFRHHVLQILGLVIPLINMQKLELTAQGPDLFSPLIRLLQSEQAPVALRLLDGFLNMSGIRMTQSQLQMSMIGARASRQYRRPFDRFQSVYGIPDESGWSVPMPAIRKDLVRENIISISKAFAEKAPPGSPGVPTPEVEFYKEDPSYTSYFPLRGGTMTSDEAILAETNMGELVSKLDTLDDFFDSADGTSPGPAIPYSRSQGGTPTSGLRNNPFSSFPGFSPKDVVVPHNVAGSSSRGFFTDSRPVTANRDVMSPSAFNPSPRAPARPGIQQRSITSPVVNQRTPPDKIINVDPEESEPFFSDDDATSFGRASTSDGSFIVEPRRQAQQTKPALRSGIRSGVRRLISGEHRLRSCAPRHLNLENSPEVPNIPEIYRQNIRSSDL